MELRKSKKAIMAFAGIMILLFHVWVPVFRNRTFLGNTERFLVNVGYVGVDIFFFLSAYTLEVVEMKDYWKFEKERFIKIMPYFFVGLFCKQFLWFIPSLMAVYIFFPLLKKFRNGRNPWLFTLLYFIGWILLILISELTPVHKLNWGIFLYRIPVLILVLPVFELKEKKFNRTLVGLILTVAGLFILYKYGWMKKLAWPFKECFYLTAIPFTLGFIYLMDVVFNKITSKVLNWIGKITLEVYFLQMVIGNWLVLNLLNLTNKTLGLSNNLSKILTDFVACAVIILASYALQFIVNKITPKKV